MLMVNILTGMNDLHTLSMMNTFFGEYWTVKNNTTNAVLTDSLNLAVMNTSLTTSLSEWVGSAFPTAWIYSTLDLISS